MDKIELVFQQAPEGVSREQIKEYLENNDGDCLKVLSILWELREDVVSNVKVDEKQQKWEDIREICNSYEREMQSFMSSNKQQQ